MKVLMNIKSNIILRYKLLCRRITRKDRFYKETEYWVHYIKWIIRRKKKRNQPPKRECSVYPSYQRIFYKNIYYPRLLIKKRIQFQYYESPCVSIIIYTDNIKRKFSECISAVSSTIDNRIAFEMIIVVDDISIKSTAEISNITGVRYIWHGKVLGRSDSYNQAVRDARGQYILFLDSSAIVLGTWLEVMLEQMHSIRNAGAVSPLALAKDGSVFDAGAMLNDSLMPEMIKEPEHPSDAQFAKPWRLDCCSSDCLLIRKELFILVGGFSDYFIGDNWFFIDFCLKLHIYGYGFFIVSAARILHRGAVVAAAKKLNAVDKLDHGKLVEKWKPYRDEIKISSPECIIKDFVRIDPSVRQPGSIAIHAHIYYKDLFSEIRDYINSMPYGFDLYISVVSDEARKDCENVFSTIKNLKRLDVRVVPNQGWDIAPMICSFPTDILEHDFFAHIHGKKSLNNPSMNGWRKYLLDGLFLNKDHIGRIFSIFKQNPTVGMCYPQSFGKLPMHWNTWGDNRSYGEMLAHRLGIGALPGGYIEFPAGSMFWARTAALASLFKLGLRPEDFAPNHFNSRDGTLAHAIERIFVPVVRHAGFEVAIIPE